MANRYSSAYCGLSEEMKDDIVAFYLQPNSQSRTAEQFNIPLHSLKKLIAERNVTREKYGEVRNKMLASSIRQTLLSNPIIIERRIATHTGAKRSDESKLRMQKAAWERMSRFPTRYVSKIETKFGEFLSRKLGVTVVPQHRIQGKPFDFLVDNKLLIEFDGPHHYDPDYFLWKNREGGFEKQQVRDANRFEIAQKAGIPIIVVTNKEVNKHGEMHSDLLHLIMYRLEYENA